MMYRFPRKCDLPTLVGIEQDNHRFRDPDFDVVCYRGYAWDAEAFRTAFAQRRDKGRGLFETRSWLATSLVEVRKKRETVEREVIHGYVVYELRPDTQHIVQLQARRNHLWADVLDYMLARAEKIARAKGRGWLTADVPETDERRLKYFLDRGFSMTRLDSTVKTTGEDAYRFSRRVKTAGTDLSFVEKQGKTR